MKYTPWLLYLSLLLTMATIALALVLLTSCRSSGLLTTSPTSGVTSTTADFTDTSVSIGAYHSASSLILDLFDTIRLLPLTPADPVPFAASASRPSSLPSVPFAASSSRPSSLPSVTFAASASRPSIYIRHTKAALTCSDTVVKRDTANHLQKVSAHKCTVVKSKGLNSYWKVVSIFVALMIVAFVLRLTRL